MKTAELYRKRMGAHVCSHGLKAKALLEGEGYTVEDHPLTSQGEVDRFKERYGVETTPQIFIGGVRIGGYDDLVGYLGKNALKQEGKSYQPVMALFGTTFLMALAVAHGRGGSFFSMLESLELFVSISMCVLGIMKLRDLFSFTNQFVSYDLLAQRWVGYGYVYPFVETGAGLLMLAGVLTWLSAPAAFVIGAIGAVSVFKAVWLDKRDLACACVGGDSSVPLGFLSLTENVMMVAMAVWMLLK